MLELKDISKNYLVDKKPFPALKKVNLFFNNAEFCSILGPSGCGKTTLLNIIGGLDQYSDGDLLIDGVSTKVYNDRDWDNYRNKKIGFVFQSYNLVPHLTILGNVELALTLEGAHRKERIALAKRALDVVGLKGIYKKKPNQLSGGQMQRVAIARALVNNPDIILADEPTGALDSVTSVQILDILKEISKSKLVIMVTHNRELALQYSNRIIELKDGEIIHDSNPSKYVPSKEEQQQKKIKLEIIDEKNKKASKKKEKKNKTSMSFLTALNISLRNLLTKKGRTILTSIAASFGITGVALVLALSNGFTNYVNRIESETASTMPINIPSYTIKYVKNEEVTLPEKFPDTNEIYPYISTSGTATYVYNNFNDKYIQYLNKLKNEDGLMNDYLINYSNSYSFNLMTEFPNSGVGIVNNQTINVTSSLISSFTGLPTSLFHVLYGQEEYITQTYEIIDGYYPTKENELVMVVDEYNRLNPTILKALGFYSSTTTASEMNDNPIKFEDLYKKKFKVFTNEDFYQSATSTTVIDNMLHTRNIYSFDNYDYDTLFNDSSKGIELKITGVLRIKETASIGVMTTGLCYLPSLQETIVNANKTSQISTIFKENYVLNKKDSSGNSLTSIDFLNELTELFSKSSVAISGLNKLFDKYFSFYDTSGQVIEATDSTTAVEQYLTLAQSKGVDLVTDELKKNGLSNILNYILEIEIDFILPTKYNDAYNDLLGLIAYINSYSTIQSIIIFPKDLTSKDKLLNALDEYNKVNVLDPDDPYHASNSNECIYYTDIVGDLTEGLGQMINVISIVLIIFASISLLVSCVMTGIITYVSVVERTKEIGILRALGARKKDVGRLFEAESCIIGGLAGVFGCLLAYIITLPINQILNALYGEYNIGNIASLNILHAILLTLISILLTFFSGLLPARIAAKKDPVIALRSE